MEKIRKQSKIRSHSEELKNFNGINNLYLGIELLGIYKEYLDDASLYMNTISFDSYYESRTNNRRYRYRNLGVQVIYNQLENCYSGYYGGTYKISRHSIKRLGITYKMQPVYVYEGIAEVSRIMIEEINRIDVLKSIYHKHILHHDITADLTFQSKCFDEYLVNRETVRQRRFFQIKEDMESLISDNSVDRGN